MITYKGKILTTEQEAHNNQILSTKSDFAIQAPPGSGKTFFLLALARQMRGKGLSLSFNKILATEAAGKFCSSVECRTGHSLAYAAVGHKYRKRLKKITGQSLADAEDIGDCRQYNNSANKGYLILNTIRKYCYSSDEVIMHTHVPNLTLLEYSDIEAMTEDLVQSATKIFSKMTSTTSSLPITHDIYLKLYGLSHPIIKKDYIFFDEYQDSNPVIADIIKSQECQKIFVGDAYQQIYSWRGAINALSDQSLNKLHITRSFRFGQPVADLCNQIIQSYYPSDHNYVEFHGNPDIQSAVSYQPDEQYDCIITRTNASVIHHTIQELNTKKKVYILGGTKDITYLIKSINDLKEHKPTKHPDLFLFRTYKDLKEYSQSPMGGDLNPTLKMIETYSYKRLMAILLSTEQDHANADVTITTTHRAKGLEWQNIKLSNDFKLPTEDSIPSLEETNILYVAASRALHNLDLSACNACWPAMFKLARDNNAAQGAIYHPDNVSQTKQATETAK